MQKELKIEDKVYQHLCLLTANDDFMSDVKAIRKKCQIPLPPIYADCGEEIFISYEETQEFEKDIEKIKSKFKLSNLYDTYLSLFLSGEDEVPHLSLANWNRKPKLEVVYAIENYELIEETEEARNTITSFEAIPVKKKIVLEIFPETAITDIQKSWLDIIKQREQLYNVKNEKFNARKWLERDLYINELSKQGKTCSEITDIINADERFKSKDVFSYHNVSKIIKRLKDKAKVITPS
ncbi:MAG: hypothetical protein WCI36_04665 [bacterium]